MAALTRNRNTNQTSAELVPLPVAAGVHLFAGAMAGIDATGNAVPGGPAAAAVVGRAECEVDNRNGAAGDQTITARRGVFVFANSAGDDLVSLAQYRQPCYAVDDQTVAKTNTGGRPLAGIVRGVTPDGSGVLVEF